LDLVTHNLQQIRAKKSGGAAVPSALSSSCMHSSDIFNSQPEAKKEKALFAIAAQLRLG